MTTAVSQWLDANYPKLAMPDAVRQELLRIVGSQYDRLATPDLWAVYFQLRGFPNVALAENFKRLYEADGVALELRSPFVAAAAGNLFQAQLLFAANDPGATYDTNDLSTLFLEGSGPTPAVVNGLVGLQLDKRLGLAAGAEVRQSGVVGLTGTATAATYNTSTGAGSVSRVDATNQSSVRFTGLSANTFYVMNFSAVSGTLAVRTGGDGGANFAVFATPRAVRVLSDAAGAITITAAVTDTVTFTLASMRSEAGNHAYTLTTSNKPILRGTPTGGNLFTAYGTPGSGWVNSGGGVATGTATSSGIPTTTAAVIGRVYRVRYTATVTAGSVQPTFGGVSLTSRSASGTYEQYITATSTAVLNFNGTGFTGTVSAIDTRDVSADAVTAPYGLHFDGVDDFLQTASADFSARDEVTVCVGVRKLSDVATAVCAEFSPSTDANQRGFTLFCPNSSGTAGYRFVSGATTNISAASTNTFAAPVTNVVSGIGDISAPVVRIRVDGVQSGIATGSQGTGNFGNYPMYFGRRGGTTLPFNGLLFSPTIIGRTLTSAEIDNLERWTNQRTGAY